jgi:hypothetical protein
MNTKSLIYIILAFLLISSCTDNFEIDPVQAKPVIVIEGYIDDSGDPARVQLTKSYTNRDELLDTIDYGSFQDFYVNKNYVTNAIVILNSNSQPDDTLISVINEDTSYCYYISSKIKGVAGQIYHLKIIYQNEVYEASSFMTSSPGIDSITFQRKHIEKENSNLYVPMVNLTDPADKENYYLFHEVYVYRDSDGKEHWNKIIGGDPWMISLFSDKYINGKTIGLNVHEGITVNDYWKNGNYWLRPNELVCIQMESITKETYEYYLALINQLNYAAGVFRPAPSNPPSNISSNGQGFFYAASVSRDSIRVPDN